MSMPEAVVQSARTTWWNFEGACVQVTLDASGKIFENQLFATPRP